MIQFCSLILRNTSWHGVMNISQGNSKVVRQYFFSLHTSRNMKERVIIYPNRNEKCAYQLCQYFEIVFYFIEKEN